MFTAFVTTPALERCDDLLGDDDARAVLRLLRRGGEMRRDDDVRRVQERAVVRLGREDVDRGACDLPRFERLDQRGLVDELAAGGVDDPDAVAHVRDRVRVDRVPRVVGQRQVQRQEVSALEHLAERRRLDPELAEALGRDERVVGDHFHLERQRAARDLAADAAEPEHAEHLVGELDPAPPRALPPPVDERGVRLRDVACEREQQPDRVLRCGDDVRARCVRDDDPPSRRRVDVDVVDPHARTTDHAQLRALLDQLGGELRRRADDDRVVVADHVLERRALVDVDVELRLQQSEPRVRDLLANQNFHASTVGRSNASNAAGTATPRSMSAPSSVSDSSTAASALAMSKMSNQPM